MERYQKVMVALSESVMETCVQRPLAEDWKWHQIRFAIKLRYLGNHAWQLKRYYGSLSWSHGRSFRIRQKKSRNAPLANKSRRRHIRRAIKPRYLGNYACIPDKKVTMERYQEVMVTLTKSAMETCVPGGGQMMTSYPVCNKTSLSWKPCIPDKTLGLLWNAIRKSWSLF